MILGMEEICSHHFETMAETRTFVAILQGGIIISRLLRWCRIRPSTVGAGFAGGNHHFRVA